jgi:ketoreductase
MSLIPSLSKIDAAAESRVHIVTGAAMGIGAAVALRLAGAGERLLLLDRDSAGLADTHAQCAATGAEVESLRVDFDDDTWVAPFDAALKRYGKVDVLVNNAGIGPDNMPEETETWRKVLRINLDAPMRLTGMCLDYMSSGGRIVNIASILGKVGNPRNTGYCASKHGIVGYTRALAMDLASRGITVNVVLPAFVDTPMLRHQLGIQASQLGVLPEQVLRNARRRVPLKRLVRSEEVAAMVGFLASAEASAITAQSLVVDGGASCGA